MKASSNGAEAWSLERSFSCSDWLDGAAMPVLRSIRLAVQPVSARFGVCQPVFVLRTAWSRLSVTESDLHPPSELFLKSSEERCLATACERSSLPPIRRLPSLRPAALHAAFTRPRSQKFFELLLTSTAQWCTTHVWLVAIPPVDGIPTQRRRSGLNE